MFYMKITGADQGAFQSESQRSGGGAICVGFGFRGEAPNDQRRGNVQLGPVVVTKPWGPSSPQIMAALWQGEVLKEIVFEFVRPDSKGAEEVFETITLHNASVSYVHRKSGGDVTQMAEGVHRELEEIGFRFESIETKHKGPSGQTVAKYDWRHREGK